MHTPALVPALDNSSYQTSPQLAGDSINNFHSYQPLLVSINQQHLQQQQQTKTYTARRNNNTSCYPSCCRIFVRRYKERSKRIDVVSRLVNIFLKFWLQKYILLKIVYK